MTIKLRILFVMLAALVGVTAVAPPAQAFQKAFGFNNVPPNTWRHDTEVHSYFEVSAGQAGFAGSYPQTESGYWCAKLRDLDNGGTFAGYVCDFGKYVTARAHAYSNHIEPWIANGQNCCNQNIGGIARTH